MGIRQSEVIGIRQSETGACLGIASNGEGLERRLRNEKGDRPCRSPYLLLLI